MAYTVRDVGYYDRVVIQELLKDIAQTAQVDTTAKHRFKGSLSCSWSASINRVSGRDK